MLALQAEGARIKIKSFNIFINLFLLIFLNIFNYKINSEAKPFYSNSNSWLWQKKFKENKVKHKFLVINRELAVANCLLT